MELSMTRSKESFLSCELEPEVQALLFPSLPLYTACFLLLILLPMRIQLSVFMNQLNSPSMSASEREEKSSPSLSPLNPSSLSR